MASRDVSPAASSQGDTVDDQQDETQSQLADPETITRSRPGSTRTPGSTRGKRRGGLVASGRGKGRSKRSSHMWMTDGVQDGTEDEGSVVSTPQTHPRSKRTKIEASPDTEARTIGTAVGTRRQANGTVGSVYSGSKIRHIKKPDGTPLWRKEIQYEFLRLVIDNEEKVFTRISDSQKNCTFADIYIDAMARSSKTSKILKDRLQIDRQAAKNMAMICLLVNVGRMNTTLNFFPEMRAQLRTYHSIPSLQAYKSQRDYKSLQDAPRLKSILKGASEDTDEPRTLESVQERPVPRTNPVNLIFVLSQFAPKVSELHFRDKVDFFDLAMRSTISSASRARAFLWLMWWYLESDFTIENGLQNPFGSGQYVTTEGEGVPTVVPELEFISEEEGDNENADPPEEVAFAEKMSKERKKIMTELASEPAGTGWVEPGPDNKILKKLKRAYADDDSMMSDAESRASPGYGRSPAPEAGNVMSSALGGQADSLDDDWEAVDPHPGRGRYKRVRGKNTPIRKPGRQSDATGGRSLLRRRITGTPDTDRMRGTPQPLQPSAANHPVLSRYGGKGDDAGRPSESGPFKSRARTGYQRELEEHKHRRIEWAIRRRRYDALKDAKDVRESGRWLLKVMRRMNARDAAYDSEEENVDDENAVDFGGLIAKRWTEHPSDDEDEDEEQQRIIPPGFEDDDCGEEVESWVKMLERTKRRLEVWSGDRDLEIRRARIAGEKPLILETAAEKRDRISYRTMPDRKPTRITLNGPSAASHAMPALGSKDGSANIYPSAKSRDKAGATGTGKGRRSTGRASTGRRGVKGRSTGRKSDGTKGKPRRVPINKRNTMVDRDTYWSKNTSHLDDEIFNDLLAERSDEDMVDAEGDAEGDDHDGDGEENNEDDVGDGDGGDDDEGDGEEGEEGEDGEEGDGDDSGEVDVDGDGDGDGDGEGGIDVEIDEVEGDEDDGPELEDSDGDIEMN